MKKWSQQVESDDLIPIHSSDIFEWVPETDNSHACGIIYYAKWKESDSDQTHFCAYIPRKSASSFYIRSEQTGETLKFKKLPDYTNVFLNKKANIKILVK
jgi:hypothetical protein